VLTLASMMRNMNQTSLGFDALHKKTHKEIFLQEMELVVPWAQLEALIAPPARGAR
jgi:IS5 family transposase